MAHTEGQGRVDLEQAHGPAGGGAHQAVRLFQFLQQLFGPFVILAPLFGEGQAPGGAVQEPGPQAGFQFHHAAGHGGLGAAQNFRRLHKAAPFHHRHQGFQFLKSILGQGASPSGILFRF